MNRVLIQVEKGKVTAVYADGPEVDIYVINRDLVCNGEDPKQVQWFPTSPPLVDRVLREAQTDARRARARLASRAA
jgi:hypothetical protein